MTIGIVLGRFLAAGSLDFPGYDHVHLEMHEFGHKARHPIQFPFSIAILNNDVFPLNIAEIPQPLAGMLDRDLGLLASVLPGQTYPRDFRRLLRVG